jgi:hypothetical protein
MSLQSLRELAQGFTPPAAPSDFGGCHVNATAFTAHCRAQGLAASLLALNYPQGFDPAGADERWRPFLLQGQLVHYVTRVAEDTVDFNACQLEPVSGPQLRTLAELRERWALARDLDADQPLWQP